MSAYPASITILGKNKCALRCDAPPLLIPLPPRLFEVRVQWRRRRHGGEPFPRSQRVIMSAPPPSPGLRKVNLLGGFSPQPLGGSYRWGFQRDQWVSRFGICHAEIVAHSPKSIPFWSRSSATVSKKSTLNQPPDTSQFPEFSI